MATGWRRGLEGGGRMDTRAAGVCICDALTARRWQKRPPKDGDWSHVPFLVARVLRRGLELDPPRRWPDARTFRRALWRTRVAKYYRNTVGVALGGLLFGMAIVRTLGVLFPPQTFQ